MSFGIKVILGVLACSWILAVHADDLSSITATTTKNHSQSKKSQRQINKLSDQTSIAREEYLSNERLSDIAEAYNDQISLLIDSQQKEMLDLQSQIKSIDETEQAVLPMLNNMVGKLEQFVEHDLPFLPKERHSRVNKLNKLLLRADVSAAEKYRQVLEAYMVEVDYGRSLEAYQGVLTQNDTNREVNFLRLGRTALYYQSLNGQQSGLWLPAEQQWRLLTGNQNLTLRKALQVAQQQSVPTLLDLPLPPLEN